jgi:DDE family transposase
MPIIPSRADQPKNPDFDRQAHRRRNAVERLVGTLKQFRRVATRYDKLAIHHLAFVQLASVMVWLRALATRPSLALRKAGRRDASHSLLPASTTGSGPAGRRQ